MRPLLLQVKSISPEKLGVFKTSLGRSANEARRIGFVNHLDAFRLLVVPLLGCRGSVFLT